MNPDSHHSLCPRCGAPVPPDAPGAQCPKCLLGAVAAATEPAPTTRVATGAWPTLEAVRSDFPDLDVESEIGRGGMAVVYKARQRHLDRLVALKILAPWLAAEPGFAERFSREARVLAKLNHPNIVTIHDFGQAGRYFFLLMEYVDGVNLRQAMQVGRFEPEQALALVPKICEALQYAHGEGVLHRDIKPDNILLDDRGRVKIADFGIAKLAGEAESAFALTQSGMRLGTPAYMAPEQVEKPADVDHRADIFSLGVVFYEMLTGELPLGRFAAPSEKSSVDARIDEIVFRTLEKERERRYQSAEEVKTRVEGLGTTPPPPPLPGPADRTPIASGAPAPFSQGSHGHSAHIEDPLSHKALAGAIATSLSLVGAVMLVAPWTIVASNVSHGPMDGTPGSAPVLLAIVPIILAALVALLVLSGILLGGSALSDIHRSGGRRRGAGLATFAALMWPILIVTGGVAGLSTLLAETLFDDVFRVAGRGWLKALVVVIGVGAVGWVHLSFIRRILRWAQEPESGTPVAAPATAVTMADATPRHGQPVTGTAPEPPLSGMALAAGILALISWLPVAGLLAMAWFMLNMSGARGPWGGVSFAEVAILFLVSGMPSLVGMILGWIAMGRIRRSNGALGGAGWAVLGGMSWLFMLCWLLGLAISVPLARAFDNPLGTLLSTALGIGLPAFFSIKIFAAAVAWTRGSSASPALTRGDRRALSLAVAVVGIAPVLVMARATHQYRVSHGMPHSLHEEFRVDGTRARIAIHEVRETVEWTQARPVQVHRLDLNLAATLSPHRRLICETRHTQPDGNEATVRRLDEATLTTGRLEDGEITLHRAFALELPPTAEVAALAAAHAELNRGWLHRPRAVWMERPERLFQVSLPDGSTFEALLVLEEAPPTS